jgi:uncharacterized damage-inducible protein DinB
MNTELEPWQRGPLEGVPTVLAPLLYSFQQAREDLQKWTAPLTDAQMWERPHGLAPVGFHIRHIGGSVERLTTYLAGGQLSDFQMAEVRAQMDPGATRAELFAEMERRMAWAESVVRAIDPATLTEPREVGRKRLPTTVAGLLVHIAEHAQRHVGQAILTAKLLQPSA